LSATRSHDAVIVDVPPFEKADLIADVIMEHLSGASDGHCVRINHLWREDAIAVRERLTQQDTALDGRLQAFLLASAGDVNFLSGEAAEIAPDRAIELRNRKQGVLCLFVPAGQHDAAASSLGNSFAEIDGRELLEMAFDRALRLMPREVSSLVRSVESAFGTAAVVRPTRSDLLDFAIATNNRAVSGDLESAGLDLWIVGLIADVGPDFTNRLRSNRRAVMSLARPSRIAASFDDRVASLKLLPETASRVRAALRGQQLSDVKGWSRALAVGEGPTFDEWHPAELPTRTDLIGLQVTPFLNQQGAHQRWTKGLDQPGGEGSLLRGLVGEKSILRVKWETTPKRPTNVSLWSVALEPVEHGSKWQDELVELPAVEKKGSIRSADLSLDISFDEWPQEAFRARVSALDATGEELKSEDGESFTAYSEEFFLVKLGDETEVSVAARKRSVSTLAEGRLRAVVEADADLDEIPSGTWSSSEQTTNYIVRANSKYNIVLTFSALLHSLQKSILQQPESLSQWALNVSEVAPADPVAILEVPFSEAISEKGRSFARARKSIFRAVQDAGNGGGIVESVVWTDDFVQHAVRYARTYLDWLNQAHDDELRVALGIDTLSVRVSAGVSNQVAAIVLPTHPLRMLWFAGHGALLEHWSGSLAGFRKNQRANLVDLRALAELQAVNCPAFVITGEANEPFVFFGHLDAAHGVALPADTPDPALRLIDLSKIVGVSAFEGQSDLNRASTLAHYLKTFTDTHPYADPLEIALVNPDDGRLLDRALEKWERRKREDSLSGTGDEDDDYLPSLPSLSLRAYAVDRRVDGASAGRMLDRLSQRRQREEERLTSRVSDHLRPAMSMTLQPTTAIEESANRGSHHLAIAQDVTSCKAIAVGLTEANGDSSGIALHGLLARFIPEFEADEEGIRWIYRIDTNTEASKHPSHKNIAQTLVDTHRAICGGIGRLLVSGPLLRDQENDHLTAALEVSLDSDKLKLLESLHGGADWVLTVDRFFGVDYYDSPDESLLQSVSKKYILDAAPEFHDGLGHRLIVTTSSRDEVSEILRRQMEDFGLSVLDESVGHILQLLKMVSGRLALDALRTDQRAAAAVALAAVVSFLQANGRLDSAIIVPADGHIELLEPRPRDDVNTSRQRCDLLLVRPIKKGFDIRLIEVKWRSSLSNGEAANLAEEMAAQMQATANVLMERYFNENRVDGALQRAALAHMLRFYLGRARRHGLIDPANANAFEAHLSIIEQDEMRLQTSNEGYIIVLRNPPSQQVWSPDDDTLIYIKTIPEIAGSVSANTIGTFASSDVSMLKGSPESDQEFQSGTIATSEPTLDSPENSAAANAQKGTASVAVEQDFEPPVSADHELVQPDVILGETRSGEAIVWKPRVAGSPHLFIVGIPGQGKSKTIERILTQLAISKTPALVFDFHGPLADPEGPYAKQANPAVLDAAKGLPFSPFSLDPRSSWLEVRQHAQSVAEILSHVFGLGDIQQDIVYRSLTRLYQKRGFSDVEDDQEEPSPPTVAELAKAIEKLERDSQARNVLARCRPFFDFDLFQPTDSTEQEFGNLLKQGVVVGLHRLGGGELPLALSAFLLRRVYLDMITWGSAEKIRLVIVLDEAHRLAKDVTLPKLMKEGRKYGVAVVVASQGLADFHQDVSGNVGSRISFKVNHLDARKVANYFQSRPNEDLASLLEKLTVGHALNQTSEMSRAQLARMYLPDD
jgi:DNA phosphorothioation-dependent restriction protein DptH